MKVLIAYATAHGSTAEVAQRMGEILQENDLTVDVENVVNIKSVAGYDAYIIGTAIHSGNWLNEAHKFIIDFADELAEKPTYCWVTCIRVLESHGYDWVLNNYMPPWLLKTLNVQELTAFAGKLDLDEVSMDEEWALALKYDGQRSARDHDGDFRDWNLIRDWTENVAQKLNDYSANPS